ncbi:MAG: transglycosylase domain-containing protein [Aquincola tertiaricarbonis]|uniref:transglycosylase domain-containing protein n=1 Tax=Aquincola TaxID=391952 RepID=UPI0006153F50|nr:MULTISPECIES: transglycosylase domain-containing protein [Aquincola]MCR5866881.1 biosynthetic peptidoglycan transglycosylase [Aquincola sp. J276]
MKQLGRWIALAVLCFLALQLYFGLRVALMVVVDPQSTAFQRSEARRLLGSQAGRQAGWSQQWVPYERIAPSLKRAVIASEDASFVDHGGVDWEAIEKAWDRNLRAEAQAEKRNQLLAQRQGKAAAKAPPVPAQPRIVGGSTITQQLAKNLFLSSERTTVRKGQELVITYMLETLLGKQRILEIYLNNVEWGEGVFGAQAAARHYFRVDAAQLGTAQAARLAVMLPAPKRFERRPGSPYIVGRAGTVAARMGAVELP